MGSYNELIPQMRSSNPALIREWTDICNKAQSEEDAWITGLLAAGVKAAHPDDGWVDRATNEVHFCYPQFNAGATVGDIIALGHPGEMRLVRLTGSREKYLLHYWSFEDIAPSAPETTTSLTKEMASVFGLICGGTIWLVLRFAGIL